jgi:hypothetical protein
MCEGLYRLRAKRSVMYSKEFMKFLYEYQKDDFEPEKDKKCEIRFKNNGGGKLAKVYVTETIRKNY